MKGRKGRNQNKRKAHCEGKNLHIKKGEKDLSLRKKIKLN